MGAPTLLGGASFAVDERSALVGQNPGIWGRRPNPAAFAILSQAVTEFRRAGYQATKAKRGKPDDVRCRCALSDGGYIHVILIAESGLGRVKPFSAMAWSFSKTADPMNKEPLRLWQELCAIIDAVVQKRFDGQPIIQLSPDQVDARFRAPHVRG